MPMPGPFTSDYTSRLNSYFGSSTEASKNARDSGPIVTALNNTTDNQNFDQVYASFCAALDAAVANARKNNRNPNPQSIRKAKDLFLEVAADRGRLTKPDSQSRRAQLRT